MLRNSEERFGTVSMTLHWVMAVVMIGLLGLGLYMEDLPREAPGRNTLYSLHKSFGVVVLILVAIRIPWTLFSRPPGPLPLFQAWEVYAAKAVKLVLYVTMVMLPVSGYMMSTLNGYPVKLFGLTLPALVEVNKKVAETPREVHDILGTVLLIALAAHILGALKHRFVDAEGADVLGRILPRREPPAPQ